MTNPDQKIRMPERAQDIYVSINPPRPTFVNINNLTNAAIISWPQLRQAYQDWGREMVVMTEWVALTFYPNCIRYRRPSTIIIAAAVHQTFPAIRFPYRVAAISDIAIDIYDLFSIWFQEEDETQP